jgi:hypothetical protein
MSKMHSVRRLRIPVRFVDGVWECAWGGVVPVKNDTEAELVVQRAAIADNAFLEAMERKGRHKVLDEGTTLLVCLTVKRDSDVPQSLRPLLKPYDYFRSSIAPVCHDYWNPASIAFVEVTLGGPEDKQARLFDSNRVGLWLLTEGAEAAGLASTTVLLPAAISTKPVASLNHAYTELSEVFEPWRISHTGNIYTRVLYRESNGIWYPLDILRNETLVTQEQELARKLWDDFMGKMSGQHAPRWRRSAR